MRTDPAADAAFREMYDATFDAVRRFCLRRLPVPDVNDAVSEVYLVAWKKVAEIPTGNEALLWLYGVARNVVRHAERSNRRRSRLDAKARRQPPGAAPDPASVVVRHTEYENLDAAMRHLSDTDQEVIRLRGWEGLTANEIAEVVGCSVAAAEKRLTRAFARLEKAFMTQHAPTTTGPVIHEAGEA